MTVYTDSLPGVEAGFGEGVRFRVGVGFGAGKGFVVGPGGVWWECSAATVAPVPYGPPDPRLVPTSASEQKQAPSWRVFPYTHRTG